MLNKKIALSCIMMILGVSGCAKESTMLGIMGSINSIDNFLDGTKSNDSIAIGGDTTSVKNLITERKIAQNEKNFKIDTHYSSQGLLLGFNDTYWVESVEVHLYGDIASRVEVSAHNIQYSKKDSVYPVNNYISSIKIACYDYEGKIYAPMSAYILIKIKKDDIVFTKKVYLSPI